MSESSNNKETTRCLITLILFLCALSSMTLAEEGWIRKADMPTARHTLSCAVVNGKIYAIGGRVGSQNLSTVEEYNPFTDTWTRKADMPTGRWGLTTFVVDGKIYAISGGTGSANISGPVEVYEPVTDTWTKKADIPMAKLKPGGGVFNGKIYTITDLLQIYDLATDTWTVGSERTPLESRPTVSMVNDKFYAIGGFGGPEDLDVFATVHEYDPLTETWTRKADMPTARGTLCSTVVNGKIYVIGGSNGTERISVVEVYDPATDTWTKMTDLQVPRRSLSACTLNGKIYAIGGLSTTGLTGAVEAFDPIPLLVDCNGDGKVDFIDYSILAECGSQAGINDVVALAQYWLTDFRLMAHWKLDEPEGFKVTDCAGGHNGFVISQNPLWQPAGGRMGGALRLNGISDYVFVDFALDPAERPFSVFAWIKGGAPGEVIISQTDGTGCGGTWLGTDPLHGKLMTSLGFPLSSLESDFVITDDAWHNVGLVFDYDESHKQLYVDGAEVAKDSLPVPLRSDGGLHLGAGKDRDSASFFSGLIDDVRIYNVALSAKEIEELAR